MSYQTPIELFNIIDTIVDSIRVTGSITASSEVSGTYTLTTVNTLAKNDYITLDSISYKVSNVTGTSFTIKAATGLDFTNQTWKANAPYFMHEKEAKAGAVLNEKTRQDNYKWQKYPLILLIHPYTQVQDSRDYSYSSTFQLILITNTEQSDWSDVRYDTNITPILRPIQESLINALATSVYTRVNNAYDIDYEWTDLLYIDGNPFPDKMDGVMLDVNGLEILEVQACVTTEPTTYNLVLSSGDGGSTDPLEGTYTFNKGDVTAVYAIIDTGYRFYRWLVNTIENTTNPLALTMNQAKNVIAEFIAQWTLTTSVSGNGTITPDSGTYDDGDLITITAEPIDPLTDELDRIEVNAVSVSTTSPYQFNIGALSEVIAYFVALYITILDVFTTTPTVIANELVFEDQSGESNNVTTKQTPVLKFETGDAAIDTGLKPSLSYTYIIDIDTTRTGTRDIVGDSVFDFIHYIFGNKLTSSMRTNTGLESCIGITEILENTIYRCAFTYDQTTKTQSIYIDGALDNSFINTGDYTDITRNVFLGGRGGSNIYTGKMQRYKYYDRALTATEILNDYNGDYINTPIQYTPMNEGIGNTLFDEIGNNNITFAKSEATAWGNLNIINELITKIGFSLFKRNSDNAILRACYQNGIAQTSIPDHTKIIDVPVGSVGFYNTDNNLLFNADVRLEDILPDNFFIANGGKFNEVYNLTPSENLLIDKQDNYIPSLIVRVGDATPPPLKLVQCYGNSITFGYNLPSNESYPSLLSEQLPFDSAVNNGLNGRTWNQMLDNFDTDITPLFDSSKKNIVILFENPNQLNATLDVNVTYQYCVDTCLLAQSRGFTVVVGTAPKVDRVYAPENLAVNELIRTNWADFSDYIIDIENVSGWEDTSVFTFDGVHPIEYQSLVTALLPIIKSIPRE